MKLIRKACLFLSIAFILFPGLLHGQGALASISGQVSDPSGAPVPNAQVQLRALQTGAVLNNTSGSTGLYSFPNLLAGSYTLTVTATGFRSFVQSGITLNINQTVRLNVKLQLGASRQTVEVRANASMLNFDNAQHVGTITPQTLQALPLVLSGQTRTVVAFVTIEPGVTSGGGDNRNMFDAKINGGQQESDEAVMDGVSMMDGSDSQDGIGLAVTGHPVSPDAVSEFSEITSNYQPQYGATMTGVFTAVTKSGTNLYHGSAYEYNRNASLNAREWGIPNRPPNIENDFGGSVGGPVKLPWLSWTRRHKTYFFVNYEGFRQRGGTTAPILSVPTTQERNGDFSDWKDSSGNLIPIYNPATTAANPNYNPSQAVGPGNLPYLRQQFPGNVIPSNDLANSSASKWLQYLPTPTFANKLLDNYVVPVPIPSTVNGDTTVFDMRADEYYGDKDHLDVTVHYYGSFLTPPSQFPKQISFDSYRAPNYNFLDRINYDHTFRPTLLNNLNFGYNDILSDERCTDAPFAGVMPQIPGVYDHNTPPVVSFDDYTGMGCNGYFNQDRPAYIVNDLLTWVKGSHLFKFGGEYRAEEMNNTQVVNDSGSFYFSQLNTGLIGLTSGNSFASFLLGDVATGSSTFPTVASNYPRQKYYALFAGDTWKATRKLTVDYGLRWDVSPPAVDKYDNFSFFDPSCSNPGAGNRPGCLAFSGTKWGSASFGRAVPEQTYYEGLGPRLGLAYAVSTKTVVRAGYGIFYSQLLYPSWNGGILGGQDGFNTNALFESSDGGISPAFLLQGGFPQNFPHPPNISPAADNGLSVGMYRDPTSGHLPYSQQWNLTVEHQFSSNLSLSVGYVGNKMTHLLSRTAPINALNPSYLSMGAELDNQFQPGQTSLDGVSIPYAGWVQQMTGCPPTVAQALLPYPQYCGTLQAANEEAGNSSFNSLQAKLEKRFSNGLWLLTSYTDEKWITDAADIQGYSQGQGISPFERERNKGLSPFDTPQSLSIGFMYDLPFGPGRHFLATKSGVIGKLVGGWQVSTIFRGQSGIPIEFNSSQCNVPSQFASGCVPAVLPGQNPFAQSTGGSYNPNTPLFNRAAFQGQSGFNFDFGNGSPVSNYRIGPFYNEDLNLVKNIALTERLNLEFSAQAFNVWNWHFFSGSNTWGTGTAFNTDLNSPLFGMPAGVITDPRAVQVAARLTF